MQETKFPHAGPHHSNQARFQGTTCQDNSYVPRHLELSSRLVLFSLGILQAESEEELVWKVYYHWVSSWITSSCRSSGVLYLSQPPLPSYIPPHSMLNVLTLFPRSSSPSLSFPPIRKPFLTAVPNRPPPIKSNMGIS